MLLGEKHGNELIYKWMVHTSCQRKSLHSVIITSIKWFNYDTSLFIYIRINLLIENVDSKDVTIFLAQLIQTLMDLGIIQQMTRAYDRERPGK